MRWLVRGLSGITVIVALALASVPASAASQTDMVGAVQQPGSFTAVVAYGDYADAGGRAWVQDPSGSFKAKITCLEVAGNSGIATAVVDQSQSAADPLGEFIVIQGVDTDEPTGNEQSGPPMELFRVSFGHDFAIFPDTAHPGCYLPFLPPAPILQGELEVTSSTA